MEEKKDYFFGFCFINPLLQHLKFTSLSWLTSFNNLFLSSHSLAWDAILDFNPAMWSCEHKK